VTLRVAERILDLIGQTPLLRLSALEPPGGAGIWARLEYLNPGGRPGGRIVTIVPDGMERHLTTGIVEVPTEAHA